MPAWSAPLHRPGFARLVISYLVNEVGDAFGAVALAVLVYDRTHHVAATTALFLCAKFLPAFLAPALTARVELLGVRRVLVALYVIEAAVFAVLALLTGAFLLPVVLALALVDGTLALTGRALTRGTSAALLEPVGALREGNAVLNVAFAVATAAGPAAAGLLVAGLGVGAALVLDAASFALIALLLARTRGLPEPDAAPVEHWSERARAGLRYVRRHPYVRALLVAESLAIVFFTITVPIEVIYAKETLSAGTVGYGALLGAWGGGIVAGSALFVVARRLPLVVLMGASTAAVGAAYLGMAGASSLLVASTFAAGGGFGNGIQWVAVLTALQEAVPSELQTRVVGLLESVAAGVLGLGFALGGAITAGFSPRTAFAVAGVGVLAVAVAAAPAVLRARAPAQPALGGG